MRMTRVMATREKKRVVALAADVGDDEVGGSSDLAAQNGADKPLAHEAATDEGGTYDILLVPQPWRKFTTARQEGGTQSRYWL